MMAKIFTETLAGSPKFNTTPEMLKTICDKLVAVADIISTQDGKVDRWSWSYTKLYMRLVSKVIEEMVEALSDMPPAIKQLIDMLQQSGADVQVINKDDLPDDTLPKHTD